MAGLHATIGVLSALKQRHATGRGQHVEVDLLSSALSGLVNQTSAFVAGGVVPFRMGNSHPSLFPYEPLPCSDGDLIITAGNDGQFRKLCEVLGLPELADDPRFLRNEDRNAHRDELRPLLVERLRTRTKMEWFRDIIGAGVPCGPINTVDQGVAFAEEVGLDPVVTVGEGADAVPSIRNPIRFSDSAPPTGCHRRGSTSTARRSAAGWAPPQEELVTESRVPDRPGGLDPRVDHAPRLRPGPRRHGHRRLRRAGVLAGHPAPAHAGGDPGVRGGAGGAGRPRLHPDRDRHPADLPVGAGLGAGRAGRRAARRRLALPRRHRGLRPVPARRPRRRARAARRRRRLGHARARDGAGAARGAPVRARAGPPRAQGRRPAHPAAVRDRRRGGAARPAPARCSPPSAGCTPRCWARRCRSTAPGSAAPRWPTSGCRWSCSAASRCWPAPPG